MVEAIGRGILVLWSWVLRSSPAPTCQCLHRLVGVKSADEGLGYCLNLRLLRGAHAILWTIILLVVDDKLHSSYVNVTVRFPNWASWDEDLVEPQ